MSNNFPKKSYTPKIIEDKWMQIWQEQNLYKTDTDFSKKKIHVLDMFPYPSGEGLHVGHSKIFTASDVFARFKRMQGFNVLHATGWDAFGLPAEQFAIKNKVNPKVSTGKNIDNFRRQMQMLGFSYDFDREVNTTSPEFYKWTQWIFLKLWEKGLVKEIYEPINWCPSCKTGLANEDLEGNLCERCGSVVEKKPLRQFSIEITKYAEKLLEGLNDLPWRENIKDLQRNWIGKSEGAEIDFQIKKSGTEIRPEYTDDVQPPKEGLKVTNRKGVMILIKHWNEEKYLLNISEKFNWKILFTGGIEEGESVYEAARREVLEETGYKNIKSIKKSNFSHIDNFQRVHKGDNARVEQNNMFVELLDGEQVERSEEEMLAHKLEWHTREEMLEIIDRRNHKFIFNYITTGDYSDFENIFTGYKKEDFFDVNQKFTIFTTRPDTLFGCTYTVLAPEHKLLQDLLQKNIISNKDEIEKYIEEIKLKTEIERSAEGREKTGIELKGVKTINPANNEEIPIFIADYVLASYGTGAIMAVPAHDERDFEFAKKYNLEIRIVIIPSESFQINNTNIISLSPGMEKKEYYKNIETPDDYKVFTGLFGFYVNSQEFTLDGDGVSNTTKQKITEFVGGKMVTKYKLRDWIFARQRYWGEPFPLVHVFDENGNKKIYPVDESELPVLLPDVENYEPTGTGESPLANIENWVNIKGYITDKNTFKEIKLENEQEFLKNNPNINLISAKRETNTMPQWAGSSWYWMRYMDPKNKDRFVGIEAEKYWGSVDVYFGGLEHATRHLIYARFWNIFLNEIGEISTKEPFQRLEAVGLVLGEGGAKMSKRLGNVVNPDDVAEKWGADTLRLYLLFMGPYADSVSWNSDNLIGPRRFIERVWNLFNIVDENFSDNIEVLKIAHYTIKKVIEDNEKLAYNTAVSQLMILLNAIEKNNIDNSGKKAISKNLYEILLKLLAPFTPFITEEIWQNLGNKNSIHLEEFPKYEEKYLQEDFSTIAIQINGKVRGEIKVFKDISEEEILQEVKKMELYQKWVGENLVKKVIFIKQKVINIVV